MRRWEMDGSEVASGWCPVTVFVAEGVEFLGSATRVGPDTEVEEIQ